LDTRPASATLAAANPDAEIIFYGIMTSSGDDVYSSYRALRETAPALLTSDGTLVLSKYADCDAALRDRSLGKGDEFFALKAAPVPEEQLRKILGYLERSLIMVNPPDHTRLRRLVNSGFTARHVETLRNTVAQRVERLLADMADEPTADFIDSFALQLPGSVISDMLGVPEVDRVALRPAILDLALLVQPTPSAEQVNRGVSAAAQVADYFTALLADKRQHPDDDLLSRLVAAHDNDALDDAEVLATALLLFLAGNKTTSDLLANSLYALITHPAALARLREEPGIAPEAVNELARFDPPMQLNARTVLKPVSFAGTQLEPGKAVITMIGSANHDPERFDDPDALILTRPDNAHLSFSAGIHYCFGAQLACLEVEELLSQVLRDYSVIELADEPKRQHGMGMRCFDRLPIALKH
jgi:cytochrome P450